MAKLISCGHWSKYYYYILITNLARFIKEDVLGISVDGKVLVDLKVTSHPIIILLVGYLSDFFLSLLLWFFLDYRRKKNEDKRNSAMIENGEYLSKQSTPDKIFELKDGPSRNATFSDETENEDLKKSASIKTDYSLKIELIHNDINLEYDTLSKRSFNFILMSSCLIVIKEMMTKIFYSNNDIFDFYFLNLITIAIIMRYFFKKKIYKHHLLSIISVAVIAIACLISCFIYVYFNDNVEGKNSKFNINFEENSHYIFVLFLIYIVISICFCTGLIFQKNLMQTKFVSSYKFLFYKGIFGIALSVIVLIITSTVTCQNGDIQQHNPYSDFKPDHKPDGDQRPDGPPPDFPINNNTNNFSEIEQHFLLFRCLDHYNEKTYYDNFISYFTYNPDIPYNTMNETFILISYFILNFVANLSIILINKFLSPVHYLITESFYSLMHIPFKYFFRYDNQDLIAEFEKNHKENEKDKLYSNFFQLGGTAIIKSIAYILELICYMIYLEIIQLNFCKFNRDLSKNIKKRAKMDAIMSEKELNEEENENDDSLEISAEYRKYRK